jgi:hypothetical protein
MLDSPIFPGKNIPPTGMAKLLKGKVCTTLCAQVKIILFDGFLS